MWNSLCSHVVTPESIQISTSIFGNYLRVLLVRCYWWFIIIIIIIIIIIYYNTQKYNTIQLVVVVVVVVVVLLVLVLVLLLLALLLCTSQFQNRPSPPPGNPRAFDSRWAPYSGEFDPKWGPPGGAFDFRVKTSVSGQKHKVFAILWLETLSTRTGGTTTAYRKFILRSGHAQNLKSWLQSAVVLSLATAHSLFWRSVDNVEIPRKVLGPFYWFTVFFLTCTCLVFTA